MAYNSPTIEFSKTDSINVPFKRLKKKKKTRSLTDDDRVQSLAKRKKNVETMIALS